MSARVTTSLVSFEWSEITRQRDRPAVMAEARKRLSGTVACGEGEWKGEVHQTHCEAQEKHTPYHMMRRYDGRTGRSQAKDPYSLRSAG
nr:hypothetical protein CFP56_01257 [Quercus suber]